MLADVLGCNPDASDELRDAGRSDVSLPLARPPFASVRLTSTPTRCVRYSAVPRMSLIGVATFLASSPACGEASLGRAACPASHSAGLVGEHRRRGDRRQGDAGRFDLVAGRVQLHPRRRADHGDVHFVAGNEPLVGRAAAGPWRRRKISRRPDSPGCSTFRPGPVQKSRPCTLRWPSGPAMSALSRPGDQRRNRVGRRRRVAQVAADARPALNLPAADDPGRIGQGRIRRRDRRRSRKCDSTAPPRPAAGRLRRARSSISSGIFLTSTTRSASRSPSRSCTMMSVPPARILAVPLCLASRAVASASVAGAG